MRQGGRASHRLELEPLEERSLLSATAPRPLSLTADGVQHLNQFATQTRIDVTQFFPLIDKLAALQGEPAQFREAFLNERHTFENNPFPTFLEAVTAVNEVTKVLDQFHEAQQQFNVVFDQLRVDDRSIALTLHQAQQLLPGSSGVFANSQNTFFASALDFGILARSVGEALTGDPSGSIGVTTQTGTVVGGQIGDTFEFDPPGSGTAILRLTRDDGGYLDGSLKVLDARGDRVGSSDHGAALELNATEGQTLIIQTSGSNVTIGAYNVSLAFIFTPGSPAPQVLPAAERIFVVATALQEGGLRIVPVLLGETSVDSGTSTPPPTPPGLGGSNEPELDNPPPGENNPLLPYYYTRLSRPPSADPMSERPSLDSIVSAGKMDGIPDVSAASLVPNFASEGPQVSVVVRREGGGNSLPSGFIDAPVLLIPTANDGPAEITWQESLPPEASSPNRPPRVADTVSVSPVGEATSPAEQADDGRLLALALLLLLPTDPLPSTDPENRRADDRTR
jgi:hypothetical protein